MDNSESILEESSIFQVNTLKAFCDWRKYDKLKIIQFADYLVVMPKDGDIKTLNKYWKIHQVNMNEIQEGDFVE